MDGLWAAGWRHFGRYFFRYSSQTGADGAAQTITPLRLDLVQFIPTKSQRRVLAKNADLRCEIGPAALDDDLRAMFQRHKQRFTHNVPDDLETFLGTDPASGPCECRMLRVFDGERLVAASFFDVGQQAASSIYGIFDPDERKRSLGIFTLLREIQYCRKAGLKWLYPGYATQESSAYDYKKQFSGTAWLDWSTGEWCSLRF